MTFFPAYDGSGNECSPTRFARGSTMPPATAMRGVSFQELLELEGFTIIGKKATCPYCHHYRAASIDLDKYLWYCHECEEGGHGVTLAKKHGVWLMRVPPLTDARYLSKEQEMLRQLWLTDQWLRDMAGMPAPASECERDSLPSEPEYS